MASDILHFSNGLLHVICCRGVARLFVQQLISMRKNVRARKEAVGYICKGSVASERFLVFQ